MTATTPGTASNSESRKRLAEQNDTRLPHWDPAVVQLIEQARAEGAAEVVEVREWCREEDEYGDKCADRAEFLLWGKLFPPEALGPRCHTHAVRHTHWGMPSRPDQWAVLDLRGLGRGPR